MKDPEKQHFGRINDEVKQFDVTGKTLLIPNMSPFASRLLAACFRAVGVNALVMETFKGLNIGKEFTSGKECFPCQVTLGDVLYFLMTEKDRLGDSFSAGNYVYFMPEADGPCRFGMYNKMQRLVLDRFEEFRDVPITYVSTKDSYSAEGIMPEEASAIFRKLTYLVVIISDIFDRIVSRVRPYEIRPGITDSFMQKAMEAVVLEVEKNGASLEFNGLFDIVEEVSSTAKTFIDTRQPRRPRIGIIGEIYVRTHPDSNQEIVKVLERMGAEVVVASVAEWINYVTYDMNREQKRKLKLAVQKLDFPSFRDIFKNLISSNIERYYQIIRQNQLYSKALKHIDIHKDHGISVLEKRLDRDRIYSFDIGTEAALSIGAAMELSHEGYNGIVNVFPFTCMPSAICTAVLKPLLNKMRMPYIDAPFDGAIQPNREIALRTFVYQAKQHLESRTPGNRNGKADKCHIKQ
jgi:predicted nucleotide-binding protein (sugar kinase/HSP70/actin superfamily)